MQHRGHITAAMYPNNDALLSKLPDPSQLTLARLAKNGFLIKDTCDTARKFRRNLRVIIEAEGLAQGITPDKSMCTRRIVGITCKMCGSRWSC